MTFHDRSSTGGPGFRTQPPMDDWSSLLQRRPNMLVVGPGAAADAFIRAVTPQLRLPVRSFVCAALPPHLPADGTLVLREVDTLNGDQQQRLVRWLDEAVDGHPQVISLTTAPLYLLVQARMFLDQLYYRLNVVHFEVISD
jgi:hypothetical protein